MLTVDRSNRIRVSRKVTREAGFHPGQAISVVADPSNKNSFSIIPTRKVARGTRSLSYSVEKDGRARIAIPAVKELGVRTSRRPKYSANTTKGAIVVTM